MKLCGVLGQSTVARLAMLEEVFEDVKGVFHSRPHLRFKPLGLHGQFFDPAFRHGFDLAPIEPHYADGRIYRKTFQLWFMHMIYFQQQWFNLSDPAADEAIYDRNSFQRFLSLDIVGYNVPDEMTILNFRYEMDKHQRNEAIFAEIVAHLAQNGLTMKPGTIVDVTGNGRDQRMGA